MENSDLIQLRQALNKKILDLAQPQGRSKPAPKKAMRKRGFTPRPPRGVAAPEPTPSVVMQPVIPNLLWDWPVAPAGEISQDQFEFCDHMPTSSDPTAAFSPSSNSFSQNYCSFLQVIDPTFEPKTVLQNAISAAQRPTIPPGDVAGPPGWVLVKTTAGLNRWQPNWIVDLTPTEFLSNAQVAGEPSTLSLSDNTTLEASISEGFKVLGVGGGKAGLTFPKLNPGDIQDIQITATSWGRVSIYPGDWFNGSLINLASDGPFLGSYTPQKIFGPRGLLSARISGIIVATGLTAKMTLSQAFISNNLKTVLAAKNLELLGINLNTEKTAENPNPIKISPAGKTAVLQVSANSTTPNIIGVLIETFQQT